MSQEQDTRRDPRINDALNNLESLIQEHYPTATFSTFEGEDPEGFYLRAAVDLEDPDEVMDLAIDQLLKLQLEEDLPVYLLAVRSEGRIAAEYAKRRLLGASRRPVPNFSSR